MVTSGKKEIRTKVVDREDKKTKNSEFRINIFMNKKIKFIGVKIINLNSLGKSLLVGTVTCESGEKMVWL